MRAITQDGYGGSELLKLVEVERPEPGIAEVLIRVRATSVNPIDVWTRETGGMAGKVVRLGWDVSGVIESVSPGVTLYQPGDEVYGVPRQPQPPGAYAEFMTSPARHLAPKPAGLSHLEAAALPAVGLSAWQALVETGDVQPGQRVLIHGAGGGFGHVAVQIAKARGAYVIGTASAGKHEFLRGLGADEVVDYTETDFAETVHDIDLVLDPIGGEYGPRSLRTLRPGGTHVALSGIVHPELFAQAEQQGHRAVFMILEADRAGLLELNALVDAGRLRPTVSTVLPLEEVAKAHELIESGHTTGKIVLTVS